MSSTYWLKLYTEILDDPKVGMLPDATYRKFMEFLMVAKEHDADGFLPPIHQIAWRLRSSIIAIEAALSELAGVGIANETPDGWLIVNFAKRQAPSDSAIRMRRFRDKRKPKKDVTRHSDVTVISPEAEAEAEAEAEEEEGPSGPGDFDAPYPKTAREAIRHPAIRVFQAATGRIPGKNQYVEVVDALRELRCRDPAVDLIGELRRYWDVWKARRTKDGRPYSQSSTAWLTDWAINGDIPPESEPAKPAGGGVSTTELRKMGLNIL